MFTRYCHWSFASGRNHIEGACHVRKVNGMCGMTIEITEI